MSSPHPDRGDHYFAADPSVPSSPRQIEMILPEGRLVPLTTDRGTFSPGQVDAGTRALLIDGPPVSPSGVVVDLGCGYGPIAVALALRSSADVHVWAVDVNKRSRDLTETNAAANDVASKVTVVDPDGFPPGTTIDQLWSNPPIRIGKAPLHDLLATWLGRLTPVTGTACLVVQKQLGADSLARWLQAEGFPTSRRATHGGYRLLDVGARR